MCLFKLATLFLVLLIINKLFLLVFYNPAEYYIEIMSIDVNEPERSKNEIEVKKLELNRTNTLFKIAFSNDF